MKGDNFFFGALFGISATFLVGYIHGYERVDNKGLDAKLVQRIEELEIKTKYVNGTCKQAALMGIEWGISYDNQDCTFNSRYYVDQFYKENYIIDFNN